MSSVAESTFIRAAHSYATSRTPVWFMRQAGRSLPEYRRARANIPMLEACARPELVAELTLQPIRRYGVDAAILFSDIVVPVHAAGIELDIVPGVGPVVANPLRVSADVDRLRVLAPEDFAPIADAVRLLTNELGSTPLIGFAGAPFTLASYLIEGGPSRTHARTKSLMYGCPELWHSLLRRLADLTLAFLRVQVESGAAAVQLFDSWVGTLSEMDYRRFVMPHSGRIFAGLAEFDVPRIHFGVGTSELLGAMAEAGADVVGVDWRVPLPEASARVGAKHALQGNLDPAVLLADWSVVEREVRRILIDGRRAAGHIFNLGHGVLPETNPDVLARVVDLVRETSASFARPALHVS